MFYQAPAPHNTCGGCLLGTAQQFYRDMLWGGSSPFLPLWNLHKVELERLSLRNFRQMVLVFILAPKTGTGLSCTIYEIPVNFSHHAADEKNRKGKRAQKDVRRIVQSRRSENRVNHWHVLKCCCQ